MVPVQNVLGEGVLWNVHSARLWWTDIESRRLYRYDPATRALDEIATPERLGSFAFVAGSNRLIAAFESGLALYDPATGAVDWAGTMVEGDGREPLGRLYCLDRGGRVSRQPDPVFISNALCTSPDGSRLYFADSPRRTIFVYDLDRISGVLSNRRLFARTPEGATPDGANVDREGFVWNAHWGAGRVVRYSPDGSIDRMVDVPASQPSCIAFGGPDMNLLFVTSARDGLKGDILLRQPSAGNLFIFRTDITGLPDADFIFDQAT
jgi:L-arabinonolactonase